MYLHRSSEPEIMDDLNYKGEVVIQTLKELDFINTWLGGNAVTMKAVQKIAEERCCGQSNQPVTLADLGCGSGHILIKIAGWARNSGIKVKLTGIDANPFIIEHARQVTSSFKEIDFLCKNVFSVSFSALRYDLITCTLFCHHFDDKQLVKLLRQLGKQAGTAIIINDIHRHWFAYHSIKWLTRMFSKSYMVKYDAKLSVLRAFKKEELEKIVNEAGFKKYSISWKWAFRYQLIIYP
jgi:2-polyprenyl-3-methyl-5-hydroxy-6-metoxy-1,4-benzoquinol methylase